MLPFSSLQARAASCNFCLRRSQRTQLRLGLHLVQLTPATCCSCTLTRHQAEQPSLPCAGYFPTLLIVLLAVFNDGAMIALAKDRVLPSELPNVWRLSNIFITGIVYGIYLSLSSWVLWCAPCSALPLHASLASSNTPGVAPAQHCHCRRRLRHLPLPLLLGPLVRAPISTASADGSCMRIWQAAILQVWRLPNTVIVGVVPGIYLSLSSWVLWCAPCSALPLQMAAACVFGKQQYSRCGACPTRSSPAMCTASTSPSPPGSSSWLCNVSAAQRTALLLLLLLHLHVKAAAGTRVLPWLPHSSRAIRTAFRVTSCACVPHTACTSCNLCLQSCGKVSRLEYKPLRIAGNPEGTAMACGYLAAETPFSLHAFHLIDLQQRKQSLPHP